MRRSPLFVAVVLLSVACSSGDTRTPATTEPATTQPTPSAQLPTTPVALVSDWPAYHGGPDRAADTAAGPRGLAHPTVAWTAHVHGAVYAAPVAVAGLVIVATEANEVDALDAATGAIRWTRSLGPPVAGGSLPCGDIDPSGVTGTPVLDVAGRVAYVVAFTGRRHVLDALDLATGAIRTSRLIDPPGLAPAVEQQRGALSLANGRVYVPFGGLYGDCGDYRGAVVSDRGEAWVTTATREAGVWAPGGPTVGPDGSLYVAVGNATTFGGNAVVRLTPELHQSDLFAPGDWLAASQADADLGSSTPLLVAGRVVQTGKTAVAYLLDPGHLGGVGGELAQTKACAAFGAGAVAGDIAYEPCRTGVIALRVAPAGLRVAWHGPRFDAGGPILAGGSVWVADLDAGDLVALDPATGRQQARVHAGTLAHFASPGLAGGRLVIGTMSGSVVAISSQP